MKEKLEQMIKITNNETNRLERKLSKGVTTTERARIQHKLRLIEERRKTLAEILDMMENDNSNALNF